MSTLNPDHVPSFPILQLEYDGEMVTLDRIIVEPATGTSPTDAGVQAVAQKAADLGLDAVRVRVTTPDGVHMMVVSSNGEAVDATAPDTASSRSRSKRVLVILAACVCAVALATTGVVVGQIVIDSNKEPVATAPPPIPGNGEAIPVGLPTGFSPEATWSVPVDSATQPTVLSNGNVLTTSPDGKLRILDEHRANTVWESSSAPSGAQQIAETTWRGRPVLASFSGRKLTLWPLDLPDSHNVPAVSIDAGATAETSFAGAAPLLDLGDYTVAVPAQKSGLRRLSIPPGTHAVAAGTDLIIAIGDNTITHTAITSGGTDETIDFDRPKGTRGAPSTAVGLTETRALVTWQSEKSATTALLDTQNGDVLSTIEGDASLGQEQPEVDREHSTAIIGPYFIDLSTSSPAIVDLDLASSGQTTLADHHVYTTNADGALDLSIKGKKVVPEQWKTLADDDPAPVSVSSSAAYVIADKVDSSILYRAPRTTQEKP